MSQDLHDDALQEQIIWYRKLEVISKNRTLPDTIQAELNQIAEGMLDVVHQIRVTCNELRPPLLKEEGIVSSLEALFELTQLRANYAIRFGSAEFREPITEEQTVALYRIVQELLANATKHAYATAVEIALSSSPECIRLKYEDNGVGMNIAATEESFDTMGVFGIKERVRSMHGKIFFSSSPRNGVSVTITIPAASVLRTARDVEYQVPKQTLLST